MKAKATFMFLICVAMTLFLEVKWSKKGGDANYW